MIKKCCFAGHSKLYGIDDIYKKLLTTVEKLILTEEISEFWVGNYGAFDKLCAKAVRELKEKYPSLMLNLVIPYLTLEINTYKEQYYSDYDNILVADIPPKTPKQLQIIKANQYMVDNADVVVCFVHHSFGGAAKTLEYAKKRQSVKIVNIGEL